MAKSVKTTVHSEGIRILRINCPSFWAGSVPEAGNAQNEPPEAYSGQVLGHRPEMLKMSSGQVLCLRPEMLKMSLLRPIAVGCGHANARCLTNPTRQRADSF